MKVGVWIGRALACLLLAGTAPLSASAEITIAENASLEIVGDAARMHALLINGGGTKRSNYNSHLRHLRELLGLLGRAGVPPERITVLASDGSDTTPDLAVREGAGSQGSWLLPSRVSRLLRPPIVYENSSIEGVELRPATRQVLGEWFAENGADLGRGDILLLYVTDHGKKNPKDLADNSILLWNGETLGVRDLSRHLSSLKAGVRVVQIMSQCYSGAFAHTIWAEESALPLGNVCGYFSVPADRQAYGCYPEASRALAGHSIRMFDALQHDPRVAAAHLEAPTVPGPLGAAAPAAGSAGSAPGEPVRWGSIPSARQDGRADRDPGTRCRRQ